MVNNLLKSPIYNNCIFFLQKSNNISLIKKQDTITKIKTN